MTEYIIQAAARLTASSDAEAQGKLDAIARILADADGELGHDWWLEAGRAIDASEIKPS